MNNEISKILEDILQQFKKGDVGSWEVISQIRDLYFEDIGFAKIDHHRSLRRCFPEVIFGRSKTDQQVTEIAEKILKYSKLLLITHTNENVYKILQEKTGGLTFNREAKLIHSNLDEKNELLEGISVICAGTSDINVAEEAAVTASLMGNKVNRIYDVGVAGIHRLLGYKEILQASNVIVCVAGMEGALPGVVGAIVGCPIIGVPTSVGYGASMQGLSPLLTMLNSCSPGVVVTNIDNGFGAGYTAGMINLKIFGKI